LSIAKCGELAQAQLALEDKVESVLTRVPTMLDLVRGNAIPGDHRERDEPGELLPDDLSVNNEE
jgi:hypothetical protein